jgi:DNA-binding IclR family transcriptional regulator
LLHLAFFRFWDKCTDMQDNTSNRFRRAAGGETPASGPRHTARRSPKSGERANGIQVISRAAAILRALRDAPTGLSLAEIADRVDLPRSTVQRIVSALATERLVMAASPTGRVRLGTGILALAIHSRIDVIELAHPHLKALSELTGETVDLALLRDDRMVFVDQVAGSHRLRAISAIGDEFPLHAPANGKASLALLDDDEIATRLKRGEMRLASGGRRRFVDLMREIGRIRKTGLAYDEEEHSIGISAVGAAFRTAGGIYAISIPTPTTRFKRGRRALSERLLTTRDIVESLLGG